MATLLKWSDREGPAPSVTTTTKAGGDLEFRIDQIHNKAQKSIPLLRPNLVTINAGSNDCIQRFEIDSIGSRMDSLLEMTWESSPRSTIILSTPLATSDTSVEAEILRTNAQYRDLVKRKREAGKRITLVDLHTAAGPSLDDLVDGVRPNDLGYQKMALLWFKGIQDCASRGLIEEPTSVV